MRSACRDCATLGAPHGDVTRPLRRWSFVPWLALALTSCDGAGGSDGGVDVWIPPPPPFDCDDELTWTQAVDVELPMSSLREIASCEPIDRAYIALPIAGACLRYRFLDGDEPERTVAITGTGTVLGVAAPAEVEIEIRNLGFSPTERRWVVTRERPVGGVLHLPAPRSIELSRPPRALLDGAYADEAYIRTTVGPAASAPHFDPLAIGDVSDFYGIVAPDGTDQPLLLRLVSRRPERGLLRGVSVAPIELPMEPGPTYVEPTGVTRLSSFVPIVHPSGMHRPAQHIPQRIDEIASSDHIDELHPAVTFILGEGVLRRVQGEDIAVVASDGQIVRALRGGCVVDRDGMILDADLQPLGPLDPSVGRALACHRGVLIGELGFAAITHGPLLGHARRLLDPDTEGHVALAGPRGSFATELEDGTSMLVPGAECR